MAMPHSPQNNLHIFIGNKEMVLREKNVIWESQYNGFPTFKGSNEETGDGIIACDFNCTI